MPDQEGVNVAQRQADKPAPMRHWEVLTQTSHGHQTVVRVEAISEEEARGGVAADNPEVTVVSATLVG